MTDRNSKYTADQETEQTEQETIGRILSRARTEQGVSLAETSTATKLKPAYLEAMEHDDFDELPAPVYARNFVRIYANYLGLDGVELSSRLGRQSGGVIGLPPKPRLSASYHVSSVLNAAIRHPYILVGAAIILLILIFYPGGSPDSETEQSVPNGSAADVSTSVDEYMPVYDLDEPLPKL